uniref:Immunoglobulin V-set domain-containing protein n=1 Tax=Catharus ustulatus TaxID=91951 RepID=A0A8C3TYL0_CATUS
KMDTAPALLLLLALGFCEYRHGVSPRDTTQLQLGQRLELECQTDRNSGAFWIHKDKKGTLHFIVFISSTSRATFQNYRTATRFEASKHDTTYYLVVKSFTPQDEGNYFCVMNLNQMLFFSPGQPAFLPGHTCALAGLRQHKGRRDLFYCISLHAEFIHFIYSHHSGTHHVCTHYQGWHN